MAWKEGDWVVFGRSVGQIKRLDDDGLASFSDGSFETSGRLVDSFRPLTLRNKRVAENFEAYYNRLREIDGEAGFNYPDINRYFTKLALNAIDDENAERSLYDKAQAFIGHARDHLPIIDGVALFRPNLRRAGAR